jgi:PAS domain S-box-containing protein
MTTPELPVDPFEHSADDWHRILFDTQPHAMWICDPNTHRVFNVNEAAIVRYGYSREEFHAMSVLDLALNGDQTKFLNCLNALPAAGVQRQLLKQYTKEGSALDVELTARLFTRQGKQAMLISAMDITDRLRAENDLRQAKSNLETAQARSHVGSWELNLITQQGSWSKEMFRLFERDESLGTPLFDEFIELVHKDDRELVLSAFATAVETGRPINFEFRTNPDKISLRHLSGDGSELCVTGGFQSFTRSGPNTINS